jgi:hypothetical protein
LRVPGRRTRLRRAIPAVVALAITATFIGSMTAVSAAELLASNVSASQALAATRSAASVIDRSAVTATANTTAAVAAATALLAASDGKVLDQTARAALSSAVTTIRGTDVAASAIHALAANLAAPAPADVPYWTLQRAQQTTATLSAMASADTRAAVAQAVTIKTRSDAVTTAVTDWTAEQQRIAAAKAAADAAAAANAAASAASAASAAANAAAQKYPVAVSHAGAGRSVASVAAPAARAATSAGVHASAGVHYTVHVRTAITSHGTSDAGVVQATINAGGQVAITYATVGGITIVTAHNFNDATALSLKPGDMVTFTGAKSGTYRVVNSMTVIAGHPVSGVLALGVTTFMQTCFFHTGTMRMVGLTPA